MNIPMAIVFATADCLALHLQKQGSHCGRVSEVRFNGLKSSRDSSRQYSSATIHARHLFLVRVSIASGVRDTKGLGHSSTFIIGLRGLQYHRHPKVSQIESLHSNTDSK